MDRQIRLAARTPLRIEVETFVEARTRARHMTRGTLYGLIVENFDVSGRVVGVVIDTLIAEGVLARSNLGHAAPKYRWCPPTE